ncbi:LamG domain-containing protein [Bowmanella sp. JS7-9]|uniref:LamG domain-containing protein n=1 Tax=Pseudobowmanella zhangzhouensis TaxID=1537679 RepID=A0ABW1XJJ3_9ALTE|nr:LamG domain-containing protein [Bowmanella sp. JS7-9]TBX27616.1 ATPase [Bowmanella sp. JS7-9]
MYKRLLTTVLLLAGLAGCGGETVSPTQTPTPPPVDNSPINYAGPPPSTDDVQQFKLALWDNISGKDRCGACHVQSSQSPHFARNDDINQAYAAANPLVNLNEPDKSALVTKVAGGHNCWLTSDSACADILTTWIANWGQNEQTSNQIKLTVPPDIQPGSSKNFPADSQLFADNVYPLLSAHCADCHKSNASVPISPYFASENQDEAYQAAKVRIDLDNPFASRLVGRLANEFHNCWSNCSNDAEALRIAIQAMADGIDVSELDTELVASRALTLPDGTIASGGGRYESAVIAKWEFKTGSGATAFDTSGVEPAIDLTLSGGYSWIGGWGVQFTNGRAQGSTSSSKKLYDLLSATGEFSIEAWVVPANVTQEGPARILSYSGGRESRNLMLGQTLYNYDFQLRHSNTDFDGLPSLSTADGDERVQASLQHVVISYDPINGRRLYVNGQFTGDADPSAIGDFNQWNDSYALVIGNEVSGDRPWAGSVRFVAIHNRALTDEQIQQNFDVGVGQKFYLLFGITHLIDVPQAYVVFTVSQFDNFSYLFSEPWFISLDDNASIPATALNGIRLGINGRELVAGQAFANVQQTLGQDYTAGSGQFLSRLGTLVPVDKGVETDEFFLTFDKLGSHDYVRVEADAPQPVSVVDLTPQPEVGMRNFAEINASMAAVTGVSLTNPQIEATYANLRQQLPTVTGLSSFVASNQMAITQMAIKYCDQLVEDSQLRSAFFSGFDFNQPASTAFASQDRNLLFDPLMSKMLGDNLLSQPQFSSVRNELNALVDKLSQCNGVAACDSRYTATIVKASCAAVLGSAALSMQ